MVTLLEDSIRNLKGEIDQTRGRFTRYETQNDKIRDLADVEKQELEPFKQMLKDTTKHDARKETHNF
jgi:TolA-binding protein